MVPPRARPPGVGGTGGSGGTGGTGDHGRQPATAMDVESEEKAIEGEAQKEEVSSTHGTSIATYTYLAGW